MSGLVLKLAPNERVLINGAVIENGNRRGRLNIVTPGANILRLRDAIHPEAAATPVGKLCYIAQLVLSGDRTMEDAREELESGIAELGKVFTGLQSHAHLEAAMHAVAEGQSYYVLKALRSLLPIEAVLLGMAHR